MNNTFYVIPKDSDVKHYGVLGMKWGVRRYQNADGSLTDAGKRKYEYPDGSISEKNKKRIESNKVLIKKAYGSSGNRDMNQLQNRLRDSYTKEEALSVLREGNKQKNLENLRKIRNNQIAFSFLNRTTNAASGVAEFLTGNFGMSVLNLGIAKALPIAATVSTVKINNLIKTIENEIDEENKSKED